MANVAFPALLAVALALEAVAMFRAVRKHFATLKSTVIARPTLVTHTLVSVTSTMGVA